MNENSPPWPSGGQNEDHKLAENDQKQNVNQRGLKNSKFDLQEFYDNKVESRNKYNERLAKQVHWKFTNCSMVSFGRESKIHEDKMYKSIKASLNDEEYLAIDSIGQYSNTKTWIIQFKDKEAFNSSISKTITIDDEPYRFHDANDIDTLQKKGNFQKSEINFYDRFLSCALAAY